MKSKFNKLFVTILLVVVVTCCGAFGVLAADNTDEAAAAASTTETTRNQHRQRPQLLPEHRPGGCCFGNRSGRYRRRHGWCFRCPRCYRC